MATGISTIGTTFGYATTANGTYTNIPIDSYSDPVGTPETIDTTCMDDTRYTNVPGLEGSNGSIDFGANYVASTFAAIEALTDEVYQKLTFSDGSSFSWKGMLTVSLSDGSVNAKVGMTLHSFISTAVTHATS